MSFTKKDFYFSVVAGLGSGLIFWRVTVFLGLTPVYGLAWAWLAVVLPILWIVGVNFGYFLGRWIGFFNQFGKFAATGLTNFAVDLGVLNLLIAKFGFTSGLIFSLFKTTSFLVAMTNGYFLNKYWTFEAAESRGGGQEFFKFFGVSVLSLLINVGVASLLVSRVTPIFGLEIKTWASLSAVAGSAVALIFNFLGFRLAVFNKQKEGRS